MLKDCSSGGWRHLLRFLLNGPRPSFAACALFPFARPPAALLPRLIRMSLLGFFGRYTMVSCLPLASGLSLPRFLAGALPIVE